MKRVINIFIWVLFSLFFLVMGALVMTQSSWFRGKVKIKVVEIVNNEVNGVVEIEELRGNFFTWIEIKGLTAVQNDGDSLLNLPRLRLKYSPFHLLNKTIKVDRVLFDEPVFWIGQDADSVWNFLEFLPESKRDKEIEKEPATFDYTIRLGAFDIVDGRFNLSARDSIIPTFVDDFNLSLNGRYFKDSLDVDLANLSFYSLNPGFELKGLKADVSTNFSQWRVSGLQLFTGHNELNADGFYKNTDVFDASLVWPGVVVDEFSFVLPDIVIPATPNLSFNVEAKQGGLLFALELSHSGESISILGSTDGFYALLADSTRHLSSVNLDVEVVNFNPNNWFYIDDIPLVLNSEFSISGNGLKPSSKPLNVSGYLRDSRWEDYLIKTGKFDLNYLSGDANANVKIGGDFGSVETKANLNTFKLNDSFTIEVNTYDLALHQVLPGVMDSSFINLSLKSKGKGLGTDDLYAEFNGEIINSLIEHIHIDSLSFLGHFEDNSLWLDTLTLQNESLAIGLNAFYSLDGNLKADLKGELNDTKAFGKYFSQPTQWEDLVFGIDLGGNIDSVNYDFYAMVQNAVLDTTVSVSGLKVDSRGSYIHKIPDINLGLDAVGINYSENLIDSLRVNAALRDSLWDGRLFARLPQQMDFEMVAEGNLPPGLEVFINQMEFSSKYAQVELADAPTQVVYNDSLIQVSGFSLIDLQDPLFSLTADAMLQQGDSLILDADISGFNLEMLSNFGVAERYMKGRANLGFHVSGNKNRFQIEGQSSLRDLESEPFAISGLDAGLNYNNDTVYIETSVFNRAGDSVLVNVATPLSVLLQDSLIISWPQTFRGRLQADNTRLSGFFLEMPGVDQPKALLSMDLLANGSVVDPEVEGYIEVVGGEVSFPKYGVDYKDIILKMSVDKNHVNMDSLFLRHLNGSMLVEGQMVMDSSLFTGKVISSDLNVMANRFYLTKHRDHEIQIDGRMFFRDEDDNPKFGGNIKVLRSSFNLPALMDMAVETSKQNEPLLLQALREPPSLELETESDVDSLISGQPLRPKTNIVEQLSGSLKINVPRNTWIRSPDMQMELYGDIDVVKSSDVFELFGVLGIHRGFYTLYGKKLIIREGEFTFTGGDEFDPMIRLSAGYVFRSPERVRHELMLIVGGRVTEPNVRFELDGQSIPEADAMAYLLFGQPFDQLSYGNQEGASSAIPSRLLTGLVSSQLSKTIGSTFSLDMIEIDAGDNWENTTFMVGKYITNNLFVTYQRSFGQAGSEAIAPETITMEYEISRRLSLRLMQGEVKDSGLDVILKFEK